MASVAENDGETCYLSQKNSFGNKFPRLYFRLERVLEPFTPSSFFCLIGWYPPEGIFLTEGGYHPVEKTEKLQNNDR